MYSADNFQQYEDQDIQTFLSCLDAPSYRAPRRFLEAHLVLATLESRVSINNYIAQHVEQLEQEHTEIKRTGLYAIGDPRPTHQVLEWGEAEAHSLAALARHLGLNGKAKVQKQATLDWLRTAMEQGYIVDVSCHGIFDVDDFLQSALLVARQRRLQLRNLLSHGVDLRGLRLLILSACQTAISDLRGARDEVHSLAAGMLRAGATPVLASLWSVDDRATYLLMVRFAQEWLPSMHDEPPTEALARAQVWLRNVTNQELQAWHSPIFRSSQ